MSPRCKCPWYCTEAEAEDIIGSQYEQALADGEPWAEEAFAHRYPEP